MIAEKRLKEDMMQEITLDEAYEKWLEYKLRRRQFKLPEALNFSEYCDLLTKSHRIEPSIGWGYKIINRGYIIV